MKVSGSPSPTGPTPTMVDVSSLTPAPWNPRLIKDVRFAQLCRSLAADPDFLWSRPVLANASGIVFAGNMRLRGSMHLGWVQVPTIIQDIPDQLAQERGLRDNNQFGEWVEDDLAAILYDLQQKGTDLDLLGFDEKEIDQLLASVGAGPTEEDAGDFTPPANPITNRGDLWILGEHRLLCGDATNEDDVRRLMDRQRAVLFATDPPYLVDYDGTNHPHKWNEPDKNKDWSEEYEDWDRWDTEKGPALYDGFIARAVEIAISDRAAWYCWHASQRRLMVEQMWLKHGAFVHQEIIWVKDRTILSRCWYMWQTEPCIFGWIKGNKPVRLSGDFLSNVWSVPTIKPGTETEHPTSKPLEVFAIPMRQHTKPGDICYEPFSGSGSQIIAGEQLGRRVFALELEPGYCDVAVRRWESVTGRQAVRE